MHPVRAHHLRHIALLAWFVLMFSPIAIAATDGCKQVGSPAVPSSSTALLDIPADLPVGAEIPSSQIALHWSWNCVAGTINAPSHWVLQLSAPVNSSAVPGLTYVYAPPSGGGWPAGIGLRVRGEAGETLALERIVTVSQGFAVKKAYAGQTAAEWSITMELVKTGSISSSNSSFSLNVNGHVPAQAWGNGMEANSRFSPSWTIRSAALKTCTVTNPMQTVNLPSISQSALAARDANAGATPFSISLKCQKGATLHITMTDANHPGSTLDVLLPKGESGTAAAVKIEREDGTRVAFGPDSSAAGTVNQWRVSDTPDGVLNIPFVASYQKSGTQAFPIGKVDVAASFTLSYQ